MPLQAFVVAALEEHLYAGEHKHGAEDAYPAAFVVMTSILGAAMTRRLSSGEDVWARWARWAQLSVYGSKLAMLLVPQVMLLELQSQLCLELRISDMGAASAALRQGQVSV